MYILLAILMIIACLMSVACDIYAPSIPAIAHSFGVHMDLVQESLVIFMLGASLSQLIYGPLSEGYGRRPPLLAGLCIAFLGSLICLYAPSVNVLIFGRLIQGIGCGAGACLWRSIFKDMFDEKQMATYGAYLSIFIIFIVPAAPALGGYLESLYGWRSSFTFLLGYTIAAFLLVIFFLKETNEHRSKDNLNFQFLKNSFKQLLLSRIFMGYTLCTFLCYGAFFSWFTVGPVLLIEKAGLTPIEFGWVALAGGGGANIIASLLNGRLLKRFGTAVMLRIGWSIMMFSGVLMMGLSQAYGLSPSAIIIPALLFYFGVTFIWPSAFAGAFGPFKKIAGYAGALYSCLQIGGAAVIGSIGAYLPDTSQLYLGAIFFTAAALAWILFEMVIASGKTENA